MNIKTMTTLGLSLVFALSMAACGDDGDSGGGSGGDTAAKGPIKIWLSNNPEELAWGEKMVDAWNAEHPDEEVTAQEIPAGDSSEEVIGAAITAGNAPCLVFNTSPAAVPQFQKQGGLVALDSFPDGKEYVEARTGDSAEQYQSADGQYYQLPWKANPVMIFYNKDLMKKAGVDPENPPLATYDEFLATSDKIVSSGAADAAIWPSPDSSFFQSWFDFYPLYAAETGGTQLVEDGAATFDTPEGQAVAEFWQTMYEKGYSQKEAYNGDSFGDGKAAMAIVGPWAIAVYGEDINWGAAPVPTSAGISPEETYTFSDAKNVAIYSACKAQGTAWEVLKFATSEEQDGALLDSTGQMPMRDGVEAAYPDYFKANPDYTEFAAQAARTVEVPNVANSIEIWQTFRDHYSESVIFGESDPADALAAAADEVDDLASQQ
jgi:multiple sugar transport system substrate-binding protein